MSREIFLRSSGTGRPTIFKTALGDNRMTARTIQSTTTQSTMVASPTSLPISDGSEPGTPPAISWNTSITDPKSGILVWKMTDATHPVSNSTGCHHDYSNGPVQISRAWGSGSDMHTCLFSIEGGGGYYLVDFQRGVGFSNYRAPILSPGTDLRFTFSKNPDTPRIAYVINGGSLRRIDTETNTVANIGNFPRTGFSAAFGWLVNSADDDWFSSNNGSGTTIAWRASTNTYLSWSGASNEAYMDHSGRYITMPNETSATSRTWDALNNVTQSYILSSSHYVHGAQLRDVAVTFDVNAGGGTMRLFSVTLSSSYVNSSSVYTGYSPDYHLAGQWYQPTVLEREQWFLGSFETETAQFGGSGKGLLRNVLCKISDVSNARHVCFHYARNGITYWAVPHSTISPDGKLVMFTSPWTGSTNITRYDVYVAEIPLAEA